MPRPRPAPIPSRLVRSAGALVWRFADRKRPLIVGERIHPSDIEVLLVHRPQYRDWSWPKGKAEPNEPLVHASVREVEEETGWAVRLWAPLTTQRYRLGSGQTKEVHYWVGTVLPDALEGSAETGAAAYRSRRPVQRASTREIDQVRWVTPKRADSLLTRRGDRRLLSELLGRAENGILVTSTIVMLRHAKAVSRSAWDGGEKDRPLTRVGGCQAMDVVDLLSAFGVDRAVTSPWSRCAATVGVWEDVSGGTVAQAPELTEDAMAADPTAGQRLVARTVKDSSAEAVAFCVHRPTIPALLEPLKAATPSALLSTYPQDSPWLSTAELLVAHVAHARHPEVLAIERHGTRTKTLLGNHKS